MSRRRKTQALNSDQQTWGTWKRQPQHLLLWQQHDKQSGEIGTNKVNISSNDDKIDDTNNNSNDYHIYAESNFGGADTPQVWTKSNGDAYVAGSLGVGTEDVAAAASGAAHSPCGPLPRHA